MKFLKNKYVIILICFTLVIALIMAVSYKTGSSAASGAFATVLTPFQKGAAFIIDGVKQTGLNVINSGKNAEENKKLKNRISKLENELRIIEGYKTENERLRQLLEFTDNAQNIDYTAAHVIGRTENEFTSSLTIDKGAKDGVKKESIVTVPEGLVGVVYEVGHNYAKVKTIYDAQSSVSAVCVRSSDMGIVEGNSSKNKICEMNYIEKDAKIVVGDVIETSGTGGIFPRGIYIGKVTELKDDERSLSLTATVETQVRLSNIDTVLVSE